MPAATNGTPIPFGARPATATIGAMSPRCLLPSRSRSHSRSGGFTLLELLAAVVVLGVLLGVALPAFMDQVRKSRRSEAFTAIAAAQQAQERYRGNNSAYASAISDLTALGAVASSSGGRYTLTVSGASATAYQVIADGTGSGQAGDGSCAKLALQASNGVITYASCSSCSSFTFAANDRCWAR
jgi:type IV pilus assembly protein PilE